jgi:hypothetical protein
LQENDKTETMRKTVMFDLVEEPFNFSSGELVLTCKCNAFRMLLNMKKMKYVCKKYASV